MKSIARFLLWSLVLLALLVGVDQFFVHVPAEAPALATVREFYLDFRSRLLGLGRKKEGPTVEGVIERAEERRTPPAPQGGEGAPRWFYVDRQGELEFVDSLEEVPPDHRQEARPLER